MPFRFLHLADLHLETAFGGRPATRNRLRSATLEAFERAVAVALDERLHAVLIAGDAFDDADLSRRTELRIAGQVRRLAEAGVWVLWCAGNHDPGDSQHRLARLGLEPEGEPASDDWRARVALFRGVRPKTIQVTDAGGVPVGAVVGAGHRGPREERNLAAGFTPLAGDLPVVALLHTQVEAARGATEHAPYAPCTREDLARLAYDYYALGHVHLRQQPFDDLPAWYAGNLQGRNPRETGAKGGLLVELEAGRPAEPRFVPLAPVRWEQRTLTDLGGCTSFPALADDLAARVEALAASIDEELCVRLELAGPCPVAARVAEDDARVALEEELADRSGALEVQVRARALYAPRDLGELRATPSVLARALELAEELERDPAAAAALAPEPLVGLDPEARDDPAARAAYLDELRVGLTADLLRRALVSEEADA